MVRIWKVCLVRWMKWLEKPLDSQGWGLVAREANPMNSVLPPFLKEGEKGLKVLNGQWFNQLCLGNKAFLKPQKDELPVWWTHGNMGRVVSPKRTWKFHASSPYLALYHLAVLNLYPFTINKHGNLLWEFKLYEDRDFFFFLFSALFTAVSLLLMNEPEFWEVRISRCKLL